MPRALPKVRLAIRCLLSALLITMTFNQQEAKAKAYFAGRMEMVERAELIALVDIGPIDNKASHKGKTWTYSQEAQARVRKIYKGQAPDKITICGGEDFICARVNLVSGEALVFLRKDGDVWCGVNWGDSIRPVKDGHVSWLNTPMSRLNDASAVPLEQAGTDIKEDIAAAPQLKTLSEPLKMLQTSCRFCDGVAGERQPPASEYAAYRKIVESGGHKDELKLLSRYGSAAGKLYAACALYLISGKKDKSALKALSESKEPVFFASGCEGFNDTVGKVARSLLKDGRYLSFQLNGDSQARPRTSP